MSSKYLWMKKKLKITVSRQNLNLKLTVYSQIDLNYLKF